MENQTYETVLIVLISEVILESSIKKTILPHFINLNNSAGICVEKSFNQRLLSNTAKQVCLIQLSLYVFDTKENKSFKTLSLLLSGINFLSYNSLMTF